MRIMIQPEVLSDLTQPYPYYVEDGGEVDRQDFWKGDPAVLLGFQNEVDVQTVNLLFDDFAADPQQAVGKYPVFARDNGSMFNLRTPIAEVHVEEA